MLRVTADRECLARELLAEVSAYTHSACCLTDGW